MIRILRSKNGQEQGVNCSIKYGNEHYLGMNGMFSVIFDGDNRLIEHSLPFKEDKPKDFLQTHGWRVLRLQAFEKYGSRCACCDCNMGKSNFSEMKWR